jgi:hypothetical protein
MYNSPSNINYLNGTHVGLAGFELNCSITESDTLMGDTGSNFLISNPNSDVEAMISIPTNVACYESNLFDFGAFLMGLGEGRRETQVD